MVFFLFLIPILACFCGVIHPVSGILGSSASLMQAGSAAGALVNKALLTPANPATDLSTALFQSMVQQQASKVGFGLSDIQNMAGVLSILNFFTSLPSNFVKQQQDWNYNNSEILVENKNFDSKTGDLTSITRLRCDLQFKGSGDVNSPLGYLVRDGKYYFTPGQNLFEVQNNASGITEVKNLLSNVFRNSILKFVGIVNFGSATAVASTISTFFDRAPFLYPQDIFVIKLLQLFNTASRNSKSGSSYPRVAHIPLESMLLLKRLSITPNYDLTMKNHSPAVSYAYQWLPDKIVYYQGPIEALNSSVININSTFLKAVIGSIVMNVSQEDWDTYQSNTMPTSDGVKLKKLVASVWMTDGYNNRSTNVLNSLLANNNFVAYTASEQKLFINTILYHISQRNAGFLLYSQLCQQMHETPGATQDQINSKVSQSALGGMGLMQQLDLGLILTIFSSRTPKIKQIITNMLTLLSRVSTNQFLDSVVQYLNNQLLAIDNEKNYYIEAVNNISDLQAKAASTSLSASDQQIAAQAVTDAISVVVKKISAFEEASAPELSQAELTDKSVSLQDYLNIKINDLHEMQDAKFRGDSGYFCNPLPLEGSSATQQAMAIVLRALGDVQSASALFKQDPKTYRMYDLDGALTDVRGPDVYAQTVAVKEKLSTAVQKKLYDQKQSIISSGTKIVDTKIVSAAAQVDDIASNLEKKWLNFCLQYPFARIKKDPTLDQLLQTQTAPSGMSQVITTVKTLASGTATTSSLDPLLTQYSTAVGTQDSAFFADCGTVAKINGFFGPNVAVILGQKIALNYLSALETIILDGNFAKFVENKVIKAQSDLDGLNETLNGTKANIDTTQGIITTNGQASSTDDPVLASSKEKLAQLKVQESALETSIATASAALMSAKQQSGDLLFFKTWFADCTDKVNNIAISASTNLDQKLKNIGAIPGDITVAVAALAAFSADVLNAAEKFAADISDGMTKGFSTVVTALVLSNIAVTVSSQNANSTVQVTALKNRINDVINNNLLTSGIIAKLDILKTIATSAQLDAVLALPDGLGSSSQDISKAVTPVVAVTTPVTPVPANPVMAGSGIPPQFGTYDPAYPKTVLRFLAEEFCDLTLRSKTFNDYGSALVDTALMALFGYNLNSLLSVMKTKQLAIMQQEITELSTYSINGAEDSPIPQAILDKIKSQATTSELSSLDASLASIPSDVLANVSENTVTSSTAPVLNIASSTGQAIDKLSGLTISITATPVLPDANTSSLSAIVSAEKQALVSASVGTSTNTNSPVITEVDSSSASSDAENLDGASPSEALSE